MFGSTDGGLKLARVPWGSAADKTKVRNHQFFDLTALSRRRFMRNPQDLARGPSADAAVVHILVFDDLVHLRIWRNRHRQCSAVRLLLRRRLLLPNTQHMDHDLHDKLCRQRLLLSI